jgi:hypothetical protein
MKRISSHVDGGPSQSHENNKVEVFNVGELVDGEIEVLRFFKLKKLEKGRESRIVTVISSASSDDTTEERDDTINNPSVGETKLRACDDTNTIHSMTDETQSTYTDETQSTYTDETKSTCTYETKSTSAYHLLCNALCQEHDCSKTA